MKGQKQIVTVRDLMAYLGTCNPDADVALVPEEGEGFMIGGVLEFQTQNPEVWILIDEFAEYESNSGVVQWTAESKESGTKERPGDMAFITEASACELEKPDVVKVRGKLRSA